jgi:hypothetical protein
MDSINSHKTGKAVFEQTTFRNTMTSREGQTPARVVQCRVINVNINNYTVDVISSFDRHRYYNIQVGSPYLHYSNGEGFTCLPEVGATCTVCLPSDSTPPFVLGFLMPFQKIDDASTPDAPQGTVAHGAPVPYPSAVTFAGGRVRAKPGDIFCRGRDGNFIVLHRGGVLQIGATELSQRIFIPLDNRVLDISENYAHHNVGGSIVWGLQEGAGKAKLPTPYVETFRVYANDKYADVRISKGNVFAPLSGAGGLSGDVVYEVAISPGGFNADSGDAVSAETSRGLVYHVGVDRAGNGTILVSGTLTGRFKKAVTVDFDQDLTLRGKTNIVINAQDSATFNGGKLTHVQGDLVRLGAGEKAVARKGDPVLCTVGPPGILTTVIFPSLPIPGPNPGTLIIFTQPLAGTISAGNDKVRA